MNSRIYISLDKIAENARRVNERCTEAGIKTAAVTKMHCADNEICRALLSAGINILADSRIDNIKKMSELSCEKWLIRIPSLSDAADVVRFADLSLNSELQTVLALDKAAVAAHKIHKVILMYDVGDLREGYFSEEELFAACRRLAGLTNIHLAGIGVSLSCYGAVLPTAQNLSRLRNAASAIENELGITFEYISGGSSTSYSLLESGSMPAGINNLRIGDTIYCGRDDITRQYLPYLHDDCFVFESEIIELKDKPSVPIGEIGYASLNRKPVFTDEGIRTRVICSAGRQDIDLDMIPAYSGMKIMEASSDHLLADITDCRENFEIGQRIRFKMLYASIMRAFTSNYVEKVYIR